MFTDDEILDIGFALEEGGFSHSQIDSYLEHYGVKGMKWGVRKDASREDKKWGKNIYSMRGAIAVHNRACQIANADLPRINNKPEYKKMFATLNDMDNYLTNKAEDSPKMRAANKMYEKYVNETATLFAVATTKAVSEIHGTSPSGRYRAEVLFNARKEPAKIVVHDQQLGHADIPVTNYTYELDLSGAWMIVGGKLVEDAAAHTTNAEDFLEHYGVKGMKWGQRRAAKAVAVAKVRSQKQDRFGNRNNDKAQRIIDRQKAVAKGKAGTLDKLRVLNTMTVQELAAESFSLKDASAARIERAKRTQREIKAGRKRVTDKLSRLGGYDVRELKY